MFPALEKELKQTLPDPYEDFMYRHLRYYGYFKAQRGSLPSSAMPQRVWKNNPRYLLSGSFRERDDLIPDPLQKEKLLWPTCRYSTVHRQIEAVSRGISCPSGPENNSFVEVSSPPLPTRAGNYHSSLRPVLPTHSLP